MKQKKFLSWFPLVLYCCLIFYLSSQKGPAKFEWPILYLDKVFHFIEYSILGFLWSVGWGEDRGSLQGWLLGALFIGVFAATDEWHQLFVPGRECDPWDWVADLLGGAFGLFFIGLTRRGPSVGKPLFGKPDV